MKKTGVAASSLLVCLSVTLSACVGKEDKRLTKELDQYVSQGLSAWDLPGLAIAVVYEDEVIVARGYGQRQLGFEAPIDEKTLFQIGSTSKAFAAASISVLVDQGKLDWDDRVVDHLPWFQTPSPEVTQHATIRDLLAHTSGIGGEIGAAVKVLSPKVAARRLNAPGTVHQRGEFLYSNAGYGLTELIVEQVTGLSWHEHTTQELLRPLGMHDSGTSPYLYWEPNYVASSFLGSALAGSISFRDAKVDNVAMPHGRNRDGSRRVQAWQSYNALAPAGSMVSNAQELGRWMRMWLGNGRIDGHQVLSAASIEEMLSPHTNEPSYFLFADDPNGSAYALGWSLQSFHGHRIAYHGGGIFGSPAFVAFFPDHRLGVAVIANGSTDSPYYPHQAIVAWVAARILDLKPRDYYGESVAAISKLSEERARREAVLEAGRDRSVAPSLSLEAYVGQYFSGPDASDLGVARLLVQNGNLTFSLSEPGEFSGVLDHWQGDTFRLYYYGGDGVEWASVFVRFDIRDEVIVGFDVDLLGRFRANPSVDP